MERGWFPLGIAARRRSAGCDARVFLGFQLYRYSNFNKTTSRHNPRFLLRQAARTLTLHVRPFFCARLSDPTLNPALTLNPFPNLTLHLNLALDSPGMRKSKIKMKSKIRKKIKSKSRTSPITAHLLEPVEVSSHPCDILPRRPSGPFRKKEFVCR
jgi:hypothetical protein